MVSGMIAATMRRRNSDFNSPCVAKPMRVVMMKVSTSPAYRIIFGMVFA